MIRDRAEILLRLIEKGTEAGYKGNDLHRFAGETFRWMEDFLDNSAPAGPKKRSAGKASQGDGG